MPFITLYRACLVLIIPTLANQFAAGIDAQHIRHTDWEGRTIPEILLLGYYANIAKW